MLFALNFSDYMSDYFLVEQSVFEFNKLSCMFTPFAVLDSLPSMFFMEYIFGFNPTNSSIIFPSESSSILLMTFLLVGSKSFESSG